MLKDSPVERPQPPPFPDKSRLPSR
jgi:hypothetical protein